MAQHHHGASDGMLPIVHEGHAHAHTHGSFRGHALPGALFIVLGVHWVLAVMTHAAAAAAATAATAAAAAATVRENDVERQQGQQQQSPQLHHAHPHLAASSSSCAINRPFYAPEYLPRCVTALLPPLRRAEPILIAVLAAVGIVVELYLHPGNSYYRSLYIDGELADDHLNVWQHAVMYLGFGVSGVASLCNYRTPPGNGSNAAASLRNLYHHHHVSYSSHGGVATTGTSIAFVVLALAFVNEATLFGFHLADGRDAIAAVDHTLLTYTIATTATTIVAQAATTGGRAGGTSFIIAAARGYLTILQGTWFFQIGMNEYSKQHKLDAEKMGHVMFVPVLFCMHAISILVAVLVLYYITVARRAPTSLLTQPGGPVLSPSHVDDLKKADACRLL